MKNVFKFLTLGMMLAAFIGASAASIFAQDIDCDATYNTFKQKLQLDKPAAQRTATIDDLSSALDLAKQYVAADKCKTDETKDIVTYLQNQITKLPQIIASRRDAEMYKKFNDSVGAKNWDDAFATGKTIIAKYPDTSLDIALVLASIGFDNAAANPAVDKYNTDTIAMARWAIDHINNKSDNYGAFSYAYKNKDYPDGKSNALGWMNYTIGYITYYRMKNQKDALPYLYKATQINSATKNFSDIYRAIGAWYLDEFNRIGTDREAKVKANNDADNDDTKAMWALQKGYLDRAIDAYSRAYKLADTAPAGKTYRDGLYDRIKQLYAIRYDQKMDGMDAFIAGVPAKPFPDPATAVTPVVEVTPASTTGIASDTTTTPNSSGSNKSTTTTTPVKTTGTKTTTTTPVKPTTPAKKPKK